MNSSFPRNNREPDHAILQHPQRPLRLPGDSCRHHPPDPASPLPSVARWCSLLPPERAALCQPRLTTGGLAQDLGAAGADDDGLGVGEDGGDGEAAGALDVHEEGARAGDEGLQRSGVKSVWMLCTGNEG